MKLLGAIFTELLGLFVDDWAFALLVLLWVGLIAAVGRPILGRGTGPALFLGLALLALIFVIRRAKR